MQKRLILFGGIILILFISMLSSQIEAKQPERKEQIAYVSILSGEVFVRPEGKKWQPIKDKYFPIYNRDEIKTENGRVEIRFLEGSIVTLDVATRLQIMIFPVREKFVLPDKKILHKRFMRRFLVLKTGVFHFDIKPSKKIQTVMLSDCHVGVIKGNMNNWLSVGAEGRFSFYKEENQHPATAIGMIYSYSLFSLRSGEIRLESTPAGEEPRAPRLFELALYPKEEKSTFEREIIALVEEESRCIARCGKPPFQPVIEVVQLEPCSEPLFFTYTSEEEKPKPKPFKPPKPKKEKPASPS